jgi:hypothetical protein
MDDLQARLTEQESKPTTTTTTTTIINNTTNNNTISLNINVFGNEDISYLTDEQREAFMLRETDGLVSMIKEIHFNPQHPENHTVALKSAKLGLASVSLGEGKMEVRPLKDVAATIINKTQRSLLRKYIMDSLYRQHIDETHRTHDGNGSRIQLWNAAVMGGCRHAVADVKRKTLAVIINGQK